MLERGRSTLVLPTGNCENEIPSLPTLVLSPQSSPCQCFASPVTTSLICCDCDKWYLFLLLTLRGTVWHLIHGDVLTENKLPNLSPKSSPSSLAKWKTTPKPLKAQLLLSVYLGIFNMLSVKCPNLFIITPWDLPVLWNLCVSTHIPFFKFYFWGHQVVTAIQAAEMC